MPIYEYTCQKCKAHIEIMQRVSDKELTKHARCGGKLDREWSRTGFQFKGSGWYVTDYAGKKPGNKESKETSGASGEKTGNETKDAKIETASEASSTTEGAVKATEAKTPEQKKATKTPSSGSKRTKD